ncbi:hypothetical protein ACFLTU_01165 [Bacteroidota bacterium]
MKQSLIYRLILFLACTILFTPSYSQQYGLSFFGYNVPKDQRTSIVLSADKEFTLKDEFELSFDLALHGSEKFIYGYIFRIILNEELNIDLIHGNRTGEERDFSIVEGRSKSDIAFNVEPTLGIDNWINLSIKLLLNEDRIIFYEGDNVFVDSSIDLNPNSSVSISFGACPFTDFISTDVPPIMIRDIRLLGKGGKLLHHWPLDQTRGENAYDLVRNKRALVTNPDWLRKTHLSWEQLQEINLKGFVQSINNQTDEKIYLLAEDLLIVFDARLNLLDTVSYNKKPGFLVRDAQAVYDPVTKQILSYNLDAKQQFYVNPVSGEVRQDELRTYSRKEFLHHNKHYNESDSSLYIYNGYGHYLYKNTMLRYHTARGIWEELQVLGEKPQPRYLSASGFLNDTLYFLGGYGSESGKQMLSPLHYYDLTAFSLKDLHFIKKDSFPKPTENFCFANSMVIDPETRDFYALAFPEFRYNSQLQLVRGNLNQEFSHNGSLDRLGSHIPYKFNDINSFADLYHFPSSEKMFALTTLNEENETSIALYSIGFPPIAEEPLPEQKSESEASNLFLKILLIILIIIILWLISRLRRKIKRDKIKIQENEEEAETTYIEDSGNKRNAINFFGGFQIIDRAGTDITNKFTPLLKELFLIIILYTIKNDKGISSSRIIEILWFEKSERSARNNLSVNITKLKNILEKLDGCELTHETGYWKIHQKKQIHNEYCEVEAITKKDKVSPDKITRLIEITNKGPFLINLDFDWLDVFKAKISDRIADVLLNYAESLDVKENAEFIIDLADCLFNFDIVNEEIMVLKCRAQYGQGKHSLAKNTYQNFCNEYKTLYGEDFSRSFNEIII